MPISTTLNKKQYNCNGAQTAFAFPYKCFAAADMLIVITDSLGAETTLVLSTGYTVAPTNNDYKNGCVVTTIGADSPYAVGNKITLVRVLTLGQSADFEPYGNLPSNTIDNVADKLMMVAQQLDEKISRQMIAPITDPTAELEIPNKTDRANKFQAFDADGLPIAALGAASVPATSFGASLIDDVDAAAARVTLNTQAQAWDSTRTYASGDVCIYNGILYHAIQIGTNQQPDTQTSYWRPYKLITATNWKHLFESSMAPFEIRPWNKSMFAKITTPTHTGTADTDLAMALKDVGANFTSVVAGAIVENTTDNVFAVVLWKSGTDTLYLDWDAFPDGNEGYKVYAEPTLPGNCIELTGALLDGTGTELVDTDTLNHLLDADGTDWTTNMSVGDWAINLNTGRVAKITAVAAHDLTLQWDCFPNGNEPYMLFDNLITISDAESLLNNAVIPEMNISGRFIRPGMTADVVQEDAGQEHYHDSLNVNFPTQGSLRDASAGSQFYGGLTVETTTGSSSTDGVNGTPRTADETRPRNLSQVMIMRIK